MKSRLISCFAGSYLKDLIKTNSNKIFSPVSSSGATARHIDVFMLTWNHFSQTIEAIRTFLDVTRYPDYTLIINDNGSEIEMQKYLEKIKKDQRVRVIQHKKPEVSFCQAMNECLKISNSEFIVTVQNDMIFKNSNWMMELVNCLERNPDAGMVGAKLVYPNGTIQHAGATFDKNGNWYHLGRGRPACKFDKEREVPGCTSSVMIVRRSAIPDGGWNEDYIRAANHNDVEMCCLMRENGWKIRYCPSSVIIHYESLTASDNLGPEQIAFNFDIFKKNCWNWLMDDMVKNPKLYEERIFLSEMLTLILKYGWHQPENWSGDTVRWIEAGASIIIAPKETCAINLSLSALSFYRPRTLEIYSDAGLVAQVTVPATRFVNVREFIHLASGENVLRFHVPEGCDRPREKPELNNPDSRCLSLAIKNFRLDELEL
jgi:GT2 family glycosyltransferase